MSWRSFKSFCDMRNDGKDDATYRAYDLLHWGDSDSAVHAAMVHLEKDAMLRFSADYIVDTLRRRLEAEDILATHGITRMWLCEWCTWHKINTGLVSQWPLRRKERHG